jgi:hypothetical protein
MNHEKKAQISTEFIMISSIALAVFLMVFTIIDRRDDEIYSGLTMLYAKTEADSLASSINTVFLAGEGAWKTVSIPETLMTGEEYTINIYPSDRLVEIRWNYSGNSRQYAAPLITAGIDGDMNLSRGTAFIVSNIDGGIVIG